MTSPVHRVLERQVRKATGADGRIDLRALLHAVHETYTEHDRDLVRIDRGNALMADELEEMVAIRERAVAAELARQTADAASAAKSQFLANMSHELRTPLNAIIGYGELVADELREDSLHSDVERILSAAQHLLQLIGDVLDLTKIESDHIQLEASTFALDDVASEALAIVAPAAESGGVTLVHSWGPDIGDICTDRLRFKQALLNLLSNAIKFSPGGRVELTLQRTAGAECDMIEVSVADNGIGMTPDELARAFNPFEQADASTTRRFGGTGLGLSIARGVVRTMGGDIVAHSAPGAGSVFLIRLPDRSQGAQAARVLPAA